jgi:hypothetical protein
MEYLSFLIVDETVAMVPLPESLKETGLDAALSPDKSFSQFLIKPPAYTDQPE